MSFMDSADFFRESITPETERIMAKHHAAIPMITCGTCGESAVESHSYPGLCTACAPARPIVVGRTTHKPPWEK